MHFVGYSIYSELLKIALNKYFGSLTYAADIYNVKAEGVWHITFKAIDSQCNIIKTFLVTCYVTIEEEWNQHTYEIDRYANLYLENLENFLNTYGELLK